MHKFGDNLKGLFLKDLKENIKLESVDVMIWGECKILVKIGFKNRELQLESNFIVHLYTELDECEIPEP